MEYTKQIKDNRAVLRLSGDLVIGHADELRSLLVDLLTESDTLELDVSSAAETDITCLQLFCASHKMAAHLGKDVCLSNEWSVPFGETVRESGFIRNTGCGPDLEKVCLWVKEQSR